MYPVDFRIAVLKLYGNVRLVGGDNGRAIFVATAEQEANGTWKHKQMKRSTYYKNTGVSKYNETLKEDKPQFLKAIEEQMSQNGGWRCRTTNGYSPSILK
jgi:hypothetical protein